MSVFNVKVDLDTIGYFDAEGNVVIEVYQQGFEEPCMTKTFSLFDLAREFVDVVVDDEGVISDCDEVDCAYRIVDELQDVIDYLNDHIEDPEELLND